MEERLQLTELNVYGCEHEKFVTDIFSVCYCYLLSQQTACSVFVRYKGLNRLVYVNIIKTVRVWMYRCRFNYFLFAHVNVAHTLQS